MLKSIAGIFGFIALAGGVSIVAFQKSDMTPVATEEDSAFVQECIATATSLLSSDEVQAEMTAARKFFQPLLKVQIPKKCRCIDGELTADLPEHEADTVRQMAALSFRGELYKKVAKREERRALRRQTREEMRDLIVDGGYTLQEGAELARKAQYGALACFR